MNDKAANDLSKGLAKLDWEYEHPISFVSRNRFSCLFNNLKPYEHYYGLGISFSEKNVAISPLKTDSRTGRSNYSFGIGFPELNIPADPNMLRELSSLINDIANQIEEASA